MNLKKLIFLVVLAVFYASCKPGKQETIAGVVSTDSARVVLKDTAGWKIDTLSSGIIKYTFAAYYQPYTSNQIVNVLEVDIPSGKFDLLMENVQPVDSLSSVAEDMENAQVAINGTYYEIVENGQSSSFLKSNHEIKTSVTIPEGHRLFWKHEGAFYFDGDKEEMGIVYGDNAIYSEMPYANIISGSPMLIYNYEPVGESFAKPQDQPLEELDYEHPDRHQGVRHPRTAIALLETGQVLLIAVDGRHPEKAAGMSAKELTQFLRKYFNPQSALNLDGGGSTTMWVHNEGIVNYPADNKRFDHEGQRKIKNYILVTSKSGEKLSFTAQE